MFEYQPFKDSTEHLNDGKTLHARLAEDGYLFLRGLLPREAILNARARLLHNRKFKNFLGLPTNRKPNKL